MAEITSMDGVARSLLDSVRALDEGKITPEALAAKRNALATVVRIAELKLSVARLVRKVPERGILEIEAR